jgi:disulfide bond formation protein DsbB
MSFLIALGGTFGSLYFSEVMKFPPCSLCWYQRICLYPLVFVLGAAIWTEDRGYKKYALPLVLAGLGIAAYHNLLYYGIIPQAISPCTEGVSCSARQLELFGFVTIPLMSLVSFFGLAALVAFDRSMVGGTRER